MIHEEHFDARNRKAPLGLFSTLNNDCLAQDRPRVLKLVTLEPSGNKDSEFKTFSASLWMKQQRKMSNHFIKNLCDETDLRWAGILLMSQRNVGTYGAQPVGNQ
jgi:hypothetical protein